MLGSHSCDPASATICDDGTLKKICENLNLQLRYYGLTSAAVKLGTESRRKLQ